MNVPDAARIVIIGGGAIGCSIAYHLAKLGQRDVLLLEKKALTAGSTWHAAGLVGQLRSRLNLTRLMQYSAKLCASIGAETGQDVGWSTGSARSRLASSDARWDELKRAAHGAKAAGLEVELIGPERDQAEISAGRSDGRARRHLDRLATAMSIPIADDGLRERRADRRA